MVSAIVPLDMEWQPSNWPLHVGPKAHMLLVIIVQVANSICAFEARRATVNIGGFTDVGETLVVVYFALL